MLLFLFSCAPVWFIFLILDDYLDTFLIHDCLFRMQYFKDNTLDFSLADVKVNGTPLCRESISRKEVSTFNFVYFGMEFFFLLQ